MVYKFKIEGNSIRLLDNISGVSGNLNYYICCFEFDSAWSGLNKFAVFSKGWSTLPLCNISIL